MPYCEIGSQQTGVDSQLNNGIKIFYRTYGHGPTKVLLIIGCSLKFSSSSYFFGYLTVVSNWVFFINVLLSDVYCDQLSGLAGTHESWGPQIKGLTGSDKPNDIAGGDNEAGYGGDGIEVCVFDNRGMGCSSIPTTKSEYT